MNIAEIKQQVAVASVTLMVLAAIYLGLVFCAKRGFPLVKRAYAWMKAKVAAFRMKRPPVVTNAIASEVVGGLPSKAATAAMLAQCSDYFAIHDAEAVPTFAALLARLAKPAEKQAAVTPSPAQVQ